MRQDMILEAIEQRGSVRLTGPARRACSLSAKRHREQVERLVEQAGLRWRDRPASIVLLTLRAKSQVSRSSGRSPANVVAVKRIERADALLQQLARHLEDGLRKAVVEAQLVGAGGVVNDELSGGDDRLAAVLEDAVHAAGCPAPPARNPRWRALFATACGTPAGRVESTRVNATGPIADCDTAPQNAPRMSDLQSRPTKVSQTMSCHTASRRSGRQELVSSTTATTDLHEPSECSSKAWFVQK